MNCPSCGYCSACGRSGYNYNRFGPYWYGLGSAGQQIGGNFMKDCTGTNSNEVINGSH